MESCEHKTSHSVINTSKTISNLHTQKRKKATEHVFAMKIIFEKAMTSCDYSTHILLLGVTKAFDTINREHLH